MNAGIARLFAWRVKQLSVREAYTPALLVESLSCEGLPYRDVPPLQYENVRAFRKLRTDARLAVATRWLSRSRS
jgi:hypothetical protein